MQKSGSHSEVPQIALNDIEENLSSKQGTCEDQNENCLEIPFNAADNIEGNLLCLGKSNVANDQRENCDDVDVIKDNPAPSQEMKNVSGNKRSFNESETCKYQYYSMDYRHKGLLLIFSHSKFDDDRFKERKAELDIKLMNVMFSELEFEMEEYKDKTVEQIKEIIKKVTKKNFKKYASLVVAISSHGSSGLIQAKDTFYHPHDVFYKHLEKVETLKGKPKIFLLGPCRGQKADHGCTFLCDSTSSLESDSSQLDIIDGEQVECSIDVDDLPPDFLLIYSTIDGYYAYNNQNYGSHYLRYLSEALNDNVKEDILSIICKANRKLSIDFISSSSIAEFNNNKQCMVFVSKLTKFLKFNK